MYRFLLFLFLLCSCKSSQSDFSERLDMWIGTPTQSLVSEWGIPDQQTSVDDTTQIYTYVLQSQSGPNNPYPQEFVYNGFPSANYGKNPNLNPTYYCNIGFVVTNGLITSYNFNGDNCLVDILPQD